MIIRPLRPDETEILKEFLYEAIFVPGGIAEEPGMDAMLRRREDSGAENPQTHLHRLRSQRLLRGNLRRRREITKITSTFFV